METKRTILILIMTSLLFSHMAIMVVNLQEFAHIAEKKNL